MGTISGQAIVDDARRILQDIIPVRWLDPELLGWLNSAQREIVLLKPNAYSITDDVTLVAGTKQSIPGDGLQLLAIVRNSNGRVIRRVDRAVLDSEIPDWHVASGAAIVVQHYVFDENDVKTFYVYPPQPTPPGSIELIYSAVPAPLADLNDPITLDDIYANPILDYVLYRAYSKDFAGANSDRAGVHFGAFAQSLGAKASAEGATSPNSGRG